MKKQNNWREEPYWHWDWPGRPDPRMMGVSGVQNLGGDDPKPGVASCLWLPDPEQRNGWREFYIYRDVQKPGQRRLGL